MHILTFPETTDHFSPQADSAIILTIRIDAHFRSEYDWLQNVLDFTVRIDIAGQYL